MPSGADLPDRRLQADEGQAAADQSQVPGQTSGSNTADEWNVRHGVVVWQLPPESPTLHRRPGLPVLNSDVQVVKVT